MKWSCLSPLAAADLLARIQTHPELCSQFVALLDEVENRAGSLNTCDDAEDAIVERIRGIGRESLQRWALKRHDDLQPAAVPGLTRAGKIDSAG